MEQKQDCSSMENAQVDSSMKSQDADFTTFFFELLAEQRY